MGLIGKEIIQSRVWIDPNNPEPPNLNYKEIYPITVYEAVKESMSEDSQNLKELLDEIKKELKNKQPIFLGKPANYLMTFAGVAGGVGSIAMSREIPWDPSKQRHDRIPTEKAVGDLLFSLGLINEDGKIDPNGGIKVRWQDVIGRPNIYNELGDNENGVMTQNAVTKEFKKIDININDIISDTNIRFNVTNTKLDNHITNKNNPHDVNINQIGAVGIETFNFHIQNFDNPHNVTKAQVGLSNVDNTADIDKPISTTARKEFDDIKNDINDIIREIDGCIIDAKYVQKSGILSLYLHNGNVITLNIPIDGLIDEIKYDIDTKEFVVYELSGEIKRIDVSDLFIRYLGSDNGQINVIIEDTEEKCIKKIIAKIDPKSITNTELADDAVSTRNIKDQNVTTDKISDLAVTNNKLGNSCITNDKILDGTIINENINDREINGRTLFSSVIDNRVLLVKENGSDPIWGQINSKMISDLSINNNHMQDNSITTRNIKDQNVTTDKISDLAVTNNKLGNSCITNSKILNGTISGEKLIKDIIFDGTPCISKRPDVESNCDQIPDTYWVNDKLYNIHVRNENILDRIIDGRTLFTSVSPNKVLCVLDKNTDPVWGTINNHMIDDNAINTNNIINGSVTSNKIADDSIRSNHITNSSVLFDHIAEGAVGSKSIYKSKEANRVLASLIDDGHPVYTKINRDMLFDNIIGTKQIENRSITLSKLETTNKSDMILGVVTGNTDPIWTKINTDMINNRAVKGRNIFSSGESNRVLCVLDENTDPAWMQISSEMIKERGITGNNIDNYSIGEYHLKDNIISDRNIKANSITSNSIKDRSITGKELFTSAAPNRVLAVTTYPYSDPEWLQVTTDMIEDRAVTREKMFTSDYSYRVLGVTDPNVPPEYLRITSDFIVDDSIIPQKLVHDQA